MATKKARASKQGVACTPEHREQFRRALEYWQAALNLDNWRVELSDAPAKDGAYATVQWDRENRLALVLLTDRWPKAPTKEQISRLALHELLHVLLADLCSAAAGGEEAEIDAAEHAVVALLEKRLFSLLGE